MGIGFQKSICFQLGHVRKASIEDCSVPNVLSAKIFKPKYFPRGYFTRASLGHNPSFTGRNIYSSKIVIKEGYIWKLGNGACIGMWN